MVNNDQKYTLSWYPNGGSFEKIPNLIEENNDLSKTFSNVSIRYRVITLHFYRLTKRSKLYLMLLCYFIQVHQLQEQVSHLADSQATTDERYSKVKQENASLNNK